MDTPLEEISESEQTIRVIGHSTYLLMPSYIVKSKKIGAGDAVSMRMLSDGSLRIVFEEEETGHD